MERRRFIIIDDFGKYFCGLAKFDVDLLRKYLKANTECALGVVNVTLAETGRLMRTG